MALENPVWNWFTDTFQINNEIKIKTDAVAIKKLIHAAASVEIEPALQKAQLLAQKARQHLLFSSLIHVSRERLSSNEKITVKQALDAVSDA
jgi:hypothetical protein